MSSSYNKSIISLIMAILIILEQWVGFPHFPEETVTIVLSVIWALLVYFVPNAEAR